MSVAVYSVYKSSGIEWLGDIPDHWCITRLGFVSWVRARLGWKGLKAEEYVDDGYVFLSTPNIKGRAIDFENVNYINEVRYKESPEVALRVGDVLLAKDGSTLGTVNVVRRLPRPATVNSSIAVITPKANLDSVFLKFLFESAYLEATIQRIKGGMGVPHLFQDDLCRFYLPLPPEPEQQAIAAFLDHETAKIDALVAEQERLIALLKEKRQAVISHAVTKGLDPNAPMKDSGVEWLGQVPAHWRIVPLMHLTDQRRQIMYGIVLPGPDVEEGVPILKGGNVRPSKLNLASVARTTFEIESSYERSRLTQGDLVYSIRGSIGDCEFVPVELSGANITQDVARIAIQSSFNPSWVRWTLLSTGVREALASGSLGAAVRGINIFDLKRARIPMPPRAEQDEIDRHISRVVLGVDSLMDEATVAITLLRERRAALISAAVTGKIDVRGFVRPEQQAA